MIGAHNDASYNDTLALYHHRLKETPSLGIFFDGPINNPNDRPLIDTILKELMTMKLGNFIHEEISLISHEGVNHKLKAALDTVIQIALKNEKFANQTILNNFIAKLMIWANTYVDGIDFTAESFPKCFYYGQLNKHSAYFLMVLALIDFDVIYFNPCGDSLLESLDTEGMSQKVIVGDLTATLEPLEARLQKGVVIEKVTTYARQASNELEQSLYQDTGVYKPWQFSSGTTRPIIMDSIIEDTLTYWHEPAKLRPGFKTGPNIVYTPVFFTKISGVYRNHNDYYEFIQKLRENTKCCFYETPRLTQVGYGQKNAINYHNYAPQTVSRQTEVSSTNYTQKDLYALAYGLNPDKTINHEKIKTQVLYQKMLSLRTELQSFILNKIDEVLQNTHFFNFEITDKDRLKLMANLFTADNQLINLIDSYDFTDEVPKVILYVNSREGFTNDDALLLGLLHTMGLDLLLLSPNGANNLEAVICPKFINQIKLDEFVHDLPLKNPTKKASFFSKLFR